MITATIMPYIPKIPAITTGMTDFIMRSGFSTPMEQIPTPLFAVPYDAPRLAKTRAQATPINPKKNALSVSVSVVLINFNKYD